MENIHIRRIIAFLIDITIAGTIAEFIGNFFPIRFKIGAFEIFNIPFTLNFTLIVIFYLLYLIVFDILKNGDTIGKLLLSITTVSKDGKKLTMKKCLVRSLYKTFSIMILPVSIFLFLIRNYYTIHDRYSDTITIQNK